MKEHYDVIVIGAGPAGRTAALHCARRGLEVACIDDRPVPGGTCLHAGSIPARAMLGAAAAGLCEIDEMTAWRREVTGRIGRDFTARLADAGVDLLRGHGSLRRNQAVTFLPAGRKRTKEIAAGNVVLAPGACQIDVPGIAVDGERIITPSQSLFLEEVPGRICILGAGVIGLEIACLWRSLGSRVTLFDARDRLLPNADETIAARAAAAFADQGLDIRMGSRVTGAVREGDGVALKYTQEGKGHTCRCDLMVVAAGRQPATEGIADPASGLLFDERGEIHIDDHCQTNLPNVYAVGDAVHGPMLSHKGIEEALHVVEMVTGHTPPPLRIDNIPSVVYTRPEIAWTGMSEARARAAGIPCLTGQAEYLSLEYGTGNGLHGGRVKLVVNAESDRLLGVHAIGHNAGEIAAIALVALELGASREDIAGMPFPYPGIAGALRKAALDCA